MNQALSTPKFQNHMRLQKLGQQEPPQFTLLVFANRIASRLHHDHGVFIHGNHLTQTLNHCLLEIDSENRCES